MTDTGRMLATVVDTDVADAFKQIAERNERTVAAELRRLVREHIEIYGDEQQDKKPVAR